jgi:CGA synthase-related protein
VALLSVWLGHEGREIHILGTARRSVLVAASDDDLDSVLVLRRIAAHLNELDLVVAEQWRNGVIPDPAPHVALVCDDAFAATEANRMGVPVVFVHSRYCVDDRPPVEAAIVCLHSPGWIPGSSRVPRTIQPVGTVAPVRLRQARTPSAALVLLALAGAAAAQVATFCSDLLRPMLAKISQPYPQRCMVVTDCQHSLVGAQLPEANVARAAAVDVDALHAEVGLFVAAPTLAACSLAQARRSSLVFLPPLVRGQRGLLYRVRAAIPIPVLGEQGLDDLAASQPDWSKIDPSPDDLRGAQRIARKVRQLVLAPL